MTTENINIILTNAICCSSKLAAEVSDMLSSGNKCANSKLNDLLVLQNYIRILNCYQNDSVESVFIYKIDYKSYESMILANTLINRKYGFKINNTLETLQGSGGPNLTDILSQIVDDSDILISYNSSYSDTKILDAVYLTTRAVCYAESLSYIVTDLSDNVISEIPFILTNPGSCDPQNCFTEDEINEIINKLMSLCDICECQLIQ